MPPNSPLFPNTNAMRGDLLFFFRKKTEMIDQHSDITDQEMREAICAVVASSPATEQFKDVFHVGIVVEPTATGSDGGGGLEHIVHAAKEQVRVDLASEVVDEISPGRVELCRVGDDREWARRAAEWALAQRGAAYNDLFSPECVDSQGRRAFYCCQLAVEAYKATNQHAPGISPFLPHKLNFIGPDGQILAYWIDYYRKLRPENPAPPQDCPGSHPSKLRASPCVSLVAFRNFECP